MADNMTDRIDFKKHENEIGTIVLLHGWGSDNQDMEFLANEWSQLYKNWNIVAFNGPINLHPGFGWFDLASPNFAESLVKARIFLEQKMENYDKQVIFIGFSQGGFVATHMALYSNLNVIGCIAFSAGIIPCLEIGKKTPIYLIHGSKDDVILPDWYNQSIIFAQEHDLQVDGIMISNMRHEINELALSYATNELNKFTNHTLVN